MNRDQDEHLANETSEKRNNESASAGEAPRAPDEADAVEFIETEDTDLAGDSASAGAEPRRGKLKRRIIAGVALLLITISSVAALYYTFSPSRSVKVNLKAKQLKQTQDATASSEKAPDDVTAEAIAEVRSAISNPGAGAKTPPSASLFPSSTQTLNTPASSTALPPDSGAADKAAETNEQDASASTVNRRNREKSIRFADEDQPITRKAGFHPTGTNTVRSDEASSNTSASTEPKTKQQSKPQSAPASLKPLTKPDVAPVVLPAFGSILPVRTLGKIYTLRSGSSIRLELTRYVSGEGWALPKGTVLVGQVRGSERDRAFIAINGFIEPSRSRFVNLSAEVLGDDGGSGIRGKFHKLSSGWSRAFARVGSAAVNVAGAIAGSRISGQPVIITDIGSRTVSPFSYEVDSALLQQNRGFVEVPAGTAGFIMVTTLPGDVKGIDPEPEHSSSDVATTGTNPGQSALTEEELASLLTSGDAARIREARPRMSPAIRRIAESVLAETTTTQSDREQKHR
jgi:hypothetical protein